MLDVGDGGVDGEEQVDHDGDNQLNCYSTVSHLDQPKLTLALSFKS